MSWFIIEPADPDCLKCKGTGIVSDCKLYGKYPGTSISYGGSSIGSCGCRAYANRKKIQDRCKHEYTCRKCGLETDVLV